MKTIAEIIKEAGGPKAIAKASRKSRSPVTHFAVQKWAARGGIPDEHWELIMSLSGVSLETLYRANKLLRSRPKQLVAA